MKFKINLQYDDISERNYVKTIYQLLDENNNSLYIKSINNNEYSYFSNRIIVDENIFYNFTKDIKKIKFVIKFQKLLSSRVIYLYYIKNENYRLFQSIILYNHMVMNLYYQSKIVYFQKGSMLFFKFYPNIYFAYLIVNYKILYILILLYIKILYIHHVLN